MIATPDSLYRVSLKSFITDEEGKVLVVKEAGRPMWDLPGGGMDHGESIKEALTRELMEEVALTGPFTYELLTYDEPHILLGRQIHQLRLIFRVIPEYLPTKPGVDSDEIAYMDPAQFEKAGHNAERNVYKYSQMIRPTVV